MVVGLLLFLIDLFALRPLSRITTTPAVEEHALV